MDRRFSLHRRYPVSGPGLPSDHSAEEDDFCSCEDGGGSTNVALNPILMVSLTRMNRSGFPTHFLDRSQSLF